SRSLRGDARAGRESPPRRRRRLLARLAPFAPCGCRRLRRHYGRPPMRAPSRTSTSSPALRAVATGHGIAVLGAVLFASGSEGAGAVAVTFLALFVALVAGRAGAVLVRRPALAPVGVVVAGIGCVLLAVTPKGVITLPIAAVLGAGVGIASPAFDASELQANRGHLIAGLVAGFVELAICALIGGRIAGLWC